MTCEKCKKPMKFIWGAKLKDIYNHPHVYKEWVCRFCMRSVAEARREQKYP